VVIIKTTGDRVIESPLSKIGDKGLFTREIETALLRGEIDLAVHSLKDLPTQLPAGLTIGAVSRRDDVRDVFLPHPASGARTLREVPPGGTIATGSLRRTCQLLAMRPDLVVVDIRGNLQTRFRKLEESDWAGMLLARAGAVRLGWTARIGETIDTAAILPAVGQGALGIEVRSDDSQTMELVRPLHDVGTWTAVSAERALLRRLEGGCQVPVGAHARIEPAAEDRETLVIEAMVGSLDGKRVVRGRHDGPAETPERLGTELAERLLREGADTILSAIRSQATAAHEPRR
jgi:hydroxymethylbilane synthase